MMCLEQWISSFIELLEGTLLRFILKKYNRIVKRRGISLRDLEEIFYTS
jgi:hypothetical protein